MQIANTEYSSFLFSSIYASKSGRGQNSALFARNTKKQFH